MSNPAQDVSSSPLSFQAPQRNQVVCKVPGELLHMYLGLALGAMSPSTHRVMSRLCERPARKYLNKEIETPRGTVCKGYFYPQQDYKRTPGLWRRVSKSSTWNLTSVVNSTGDTF